jgi:hypothetical protein
MSSADGAEYYFSLQAEGMGVSIEIFLVTLVFSLPLGLLVALREE